MVDHLIRNVEFGIFGGKQPTSFGRTDPGYQPSERCRGWDNRGMSPTSRGRPPGRGRSRRPASGRRPAGKLQRAGSISGWAAEEDTDCWLDDPLPGDRRSWAVPPGHGSYQGLELEQLDPDDEDERTFLLEAQRLAGLGYDWHNVMHLIMGPVTEAVWNALAEKRPFDRADYLRRLAELPGDWPSPEELGHPDS